jgi:hypothetical protein
VRRCKSKEGEIPGEGCDEKIGAWGGCLELAALVEAGGSDDRRGFDRDGCVDASGGVNKGNWASAPPRTA